ncbi:hypothetical protein OS493_037911 [Desmophyllum pertusum]|uniref:Uncharacterized protein n=1 Tax=Desmophyllum pertusum TaxID=174260 RepID=A0A9X0CN91_9CNID|nr:hypothetical protein OS493_037911 [Desmophyllum pertusum]
MYFGYVLFILLYIITVNNRAVARRVKVHRFPSGIDEFEVTDNNKNICTAPEKAKEFCAKHGAINVQNTGESECSDHERTIHCRCNSTKSTFLLHEERCVNNENITRNIHGGTFSDCKFHLAVQNGRNPPRCQTSPVSTLSTNISDTRRYSLCTAHASQDVVNCKIDENNAFYDKAGRWRRLWRLVQRGQSAGAQETTLDGLLQKLISNASRYSGLIVSLQATCLMKSQLNMRLRGQPPYDKLHSCLLLKVSGSRSLTLKPHQLSLKQMNSDITHNQSRYHTGQNETEGNTTIISQATTQQSPTTVPVAELDTEKTEIPSDDNFSLFLKVILIIMGCLTGVLCAQLFHCCWEFASGRRRVHRYKTYMRRRSVDVYQPLVENTRPHSVNGYNNIYESLRSVGNNPVPRRFSYSLYQDLIRASVITSSSTYQAMFAPLETTTRDSFPESSNNDFATVASNGPECDFRVTRENQRRSEPELLDGMDCPLDETRASDLTDRCQSSLSSSLQEEGMVAVGIEFDGDSASVVSLSSLTFCEEEDYQENEQTVLESDSTVNNDSSDEHQHQYLEIVNTTCNNESSESDIPHDGLHDRESDTTSDMTVNWIHLVMAYMTVNRIHLVMAYMTVNWIHLVMAYMTVNQTVYQSVD